jgi:predicted mannosyl-3-phosphoglycerate phosphatase (HAD superfamily)
MALGDMEDDRPCLEQGEIAFLVGRNLAEGMKRQMSGFLHRTERNKANLVGLAHFFKCPANAGITRQSLAAIG